MKLGLGIGFITMCVLTVAGESKQLGSVPAANPHATNLSFAVKGTVRKLTLEDRTVVIAHDIVSNYMPAMTMPFKVRETNLLTGLEVGDEISFRLLVGPEESWIDRIERTGKRDALTDPVGSQTNSIVKAGSGSRHPLFDYQFTNQLGQAVSLSQFKGQALAITFIFTRCPIPEYCPRLSKNFEEASRKLAAMPNAPTNWHFLSVTFDPAFDTPGVLRAYAQNYRSDPQHWSFITGAPEKIAELAQASGVTATPDGVFYNHNFRTLIINPRGELQTSFPISGDLSDAIVGELLKAAAMTSQ